MIDKVYIVYTNERNASVAGVFLSKEVAKQTIANSNGNLLDIEPEEWKIIGNLPYSEEELRSKVKFNVSLVGTVDDTDYLEMSRFSVKDFTGKITDALLDSIYKLFGGDGK